MAEMWCLTMNANAGPSRFRFTPSGRPTFWILYEQRYNSTGNGNSADQDIRTIRRESKNPNGCQAERTSCQDNQFSYQTKLAVKEKQKKRLCYGLTLLEDFGKETLSPAPRPCWIPRCHRQPAYRIFDQDLPAKTVANPQGGNFTRHGSLGLYWSIVLNTRSDIHL